MVFLTARLTRNGLPLKSTIHHVYNIAEPESQILGKQLRVVCGPHADYCDEDGVYTVELLAAPQPIPNLPFFNSRYQPMWEHAIIPVC
jgi:hypothetical protein